MERESKGVEQRVTICGECMAIEDEDSAGNKIWRNVNVGITPKMTTHEKRVIIEPYAQAFLDHGIKPSHGYCPTHAEKAYEEMLTNPPKGNTKRITLAYDLDGTLYDTLDSVFRVDQEIRTDLGYDPISKDDYRAHFQSRDWNKLYRDLGIREEDVSKVISMFIERFKEAEVPYLIPDAKDAIERSERVLGKDNIFIVTNETSEGVAKRFERDGLTRYSDRVKNPFKGKSRELYDLALADGNREFPFVYVGDLVSDGEDCKVAREMGAENLRFYGLVHEYSFSTPQAMNLFVSANQDFAKTLNNLREIHRVWKGI